MLLSKSGLGISSNDFPSNWIYPEYIFPFEIIRIMDKPSVLLPHALSPAIPIDSPNLIEKLTSSSACTKPLETLYLVVKFSTEINDILSFKMG